MIKLKARRILIQIISNPKQHHLYNRRGKLMITANYSVLGLLAMLRVTATIKAKPKFVELLI